MAIRSNVLVWMLLALLVGACNTEDDSSGYQSGDQPPLSGSGGAGTGGTNATGGSTASGGVDNSGETTLPAELGKNCVAGLYVGTFDIAINQGALEIELGGVDAVACATDEEFCFAEVVEGASISVMDQWGGTIGGPLEGGVNCHTGDFSASTIDVGNPEPWPDDCVGGFMGIDGGCRVELTGKFDPATRTIAGMVDIATEVAATAGGPFEITLTP